MLKLLTLDQAALHILHWPSKTSDPYAPGVLQNVLDNEDLHRESFRLLMFLHNAIDAGELPALKKAKSKYND